MAEKGFSEYFVNDGSDFSVDHGAILIVDMLNDFCKDGGKMPLKEGMETVEPLKALIANNLTPAYPTHPGEVLKEEIEYRKIRSVSYQSRWASPIRY